MTWLRNIHTHTIFHVACTYIIYRVALLGRDNCSCKVRLTNKSFIFHYSVNFFFFIIITFVDEILGAKLSFCCHGNQLVCILTITNLTSSVCSGN